VERLTLRAFLTILTIIMGGAMLIGGGAMAIIAASSNEAVGPIYGILFSLAGAAAVLMGVLCARDLWSGSRRHVQQPGQPPASAPQPPTPASSGGHTRPTDASLTSGIAAAPEDVTLTEEAARLLKKRMLKARARPDQCVRLRGEPEKCALTIDKPRTGDRTLVRNGDSIVILDPETYDQFRGVVIDCVESRKGRRLRFRSKGRQIQRAS
jgi:hypothetical protein